MVVWFLDVSAVSTVHSMNEHTRNAQSRKRLLMAGVSAVVLISLVSLGLFSIFSSSRLNQRLADLRSRGLPTNAVELNAYYSVPPDVTDTTELWVAATTAIKNAGIEQRVAKIPIVGLGPTPVPEPGKEWAELEISRTFLEELDGELQHIRRAADARGMARYPVDFTLGLNAVLTAIQEVRTVARLLTLRAHVHAHDGEDSETFKDVTAIFTVSDSLRGNPIVISQLERIATHAIGCELTGDMLPHCQWTDEELESLQVALGRADFRQELRTAFHGELANCLTTLEMTPAIPFRGENKLKAIELLEEFTDGLGTSWLDATTRHQKIDAELKTISANMISRMKYMSMMQMLPALQTAVNAGMRAEARQNCAIVTIAACRHRFQHGTLPNSLTDFKDLIPGDASVKSLRLIDPFDGQSLRFKSDNGRVLIYSIGNNKVDEGGDIANERLLEGDLGYSVAE